MKWLIFCLTEGLLWYSTMYVSTTRQLCTATCSANRSSYMRGQYWIKNLLHIDRVMCAGNSLKNGPETHPEPWTYLPLPLYNNICFVCRVYVECKLRYPAYWQLPISGMCENDAHTLQCSHHMINWLLSVFEIYGVRQIFFECGLRCSAYRQLSISGMCGNDAKGIHKVRVVINAFLIMPPKGCSL